MLKVPALRFALALMLMQAAGLALLAVAEDRAQILVGTVVFGVTMGNSLMMHPLLLAERFGTRDYGRIYSTSQLVTVMGVASCPALIGVLYEASGGYAAAVLRRHRRDADRPRRARPVRHGATLRRQFTPTARLIVEPISALITRSANSSWSVGSRLTMTRRDPLRLASIGKPAAG